MQYLILQALNNKYVGSNKSKTINGASRVERMAGKVARVRSDGRSRRSIALESTQAVYAYPGKLTAYRHVASFLG